MKIGIEVTHANKIKRTGVEEVCFQVIKEFKKIIPKNVGVILYTNKPLIDDLKNLPENWEVKILNWPFKKLWSQLRLSLEFLFFPPDIFFAPGQLIPFITPQNTVVFVHDSAFEAYPKAYRFLGRFYLKWMNRLIAKKAKIIITSTEFNKNEMVKYYGKKIKRKIKVIPLAVDDVLCIKNKVNEFDDDLLKNNRYILSVGRLEEKKNTAGIIRAFDKIKKIEKFSKIKLVLIGGHGFGYKKVEKTLELSLNKKDIILAGWVDNKELSYYYASADVFVFPSFYEGFGLPILEAMGAGCPVVASDILSIKEVGGKAITYVKVGDDSDLAKKIIEILINSDTREKKVVEGYERFSHFSWNKTAKQIWEVLGLLKKG